MSEQWHEVHDAYVTEHGDEFRPEAVAAADDATREFSFAPGARWLVEDALSVRGIYGSGAKIQWLEGMTFTLANEKRREFITGITR